jgi:hypothetical protein
VIDPKKALAAQDAKGEQAEVEARSQLVEMVTGGLAPDDVATSLLRADWLGEVGRAGTALAILYGADWVGLRNEETYMALFLLFVYPAWTTRAAWLPLRGRRPGAWLSDVLTQVQACAQGLLLAFLASWASIGLLELMLGRLYRLGDVIQFTVLAVVAGVGVSTLAWATGRALVDREVEALPRDAIPPTADLEVAQQSLSAAPLVGAVARSWFRAALVTLFFFGPVLALDPRRNLDVPRHLVQAWLMFGGLLAASTLGRQILTTVMARSASGALLERARALPERTATEEEASALVPESPGALAWQRIRQPLEMLTPAFLAATCGYMVVEAGMRFGSLSGYVAALGLGAVTALRAAPPEQRHLVAPFRLAVGAGLGALVFGTLGVILPEVAGALRGLSRPLRTLGFPAFFLAATLLSERLVTLWGVAVARISGSLESGKRDPIWSTITRSLNAGVLPGAVLFLSGIALAHSGYWRLGDRLIGASFMATAVMALQVCAQLRLAEAMAPAALPAEPAAPETPLGS